MRAPIALSFAAGLVPAAAPAAQTKQATAASTTALPTGALALFTDVDGRDVRDVVEAPSSDGG